MKTNTFAISAPCGQETFHFLQNSPKNLFLRGATCNVIGQLVLVAYVFYVNLNVLRREMHNAWTDLAFEMIKGSRPGIFRCPEEDFEATSIESVSKHMLNGCRRTELFRNIFSESDTSRRKKKGPENVDDFIKSIRALEAGDVPPSVRSISDSALKTFRSLSMDDFNFLNAEVLPFPSPLLLALTQFDSSGSRLLMTK